MAHYPQSATGLAYATYPVGPAGAALETISSGSTNTKGSYVQVVASLGLTATSIRVVVTRTTAGTNARQYLDVATGAGGAETVVVPDLLAENQTSTTSHNGAAAFDLPLAVASGTRVAVRNASNAATQSLFVSVTFVAAGATPGVASFVTYGLAATTSATAVDPGGSANTKGSYAQLTASTSAVAQVLVPMVTRGGLAATGPAQLALDLATGAGGAETVLLPDLRFGYPINTQAARVSLRALTFLTYIPASTRLAARASSDSTVAGDRVVQVAALVATAPSEASGAGTVAVGYVG